MFFSDSCGVMKLPHLPSGVLDDGPEMLFTSVGFVLALCVCNCMWGGMCMEGLISPTLFETVSLPCVQGLLGSDPELIQPPSTVAMVLGSQGARKSGPHTGPLGSGLSPLGQRPHDGCFSCHTGSHGQPKSTCPKTLRMTSLPPLCHTPQSHSPLLGLLTMSLMDTGAKACATRPRKTSSQSWLGQRCPPCRPRA